MDRKKALLLLSLVTIASTAYSKDAWVNVNRLNIRTCSDTSCGNVGQLIFREKVTIFEKIDGWARISDYYDGSCKNGISKFVDNGNNECTWINGFEDDIFAEWVSARYLSEKHPIEHTEKVLSK
jgi:hypothetical protein